MSAGTNNSGRRNITATWRSRCSKAACTSALPFIARICWRSGARAGLRVGLLGWTEEGVEEALAALRKSLELDPGVANTWSNLGITLGKLGRPEEAFDIMRKLGIGITDQDLDSIPIGLICSTNSSGDNM